VLAERVRAAVDPPDTAHSGPVRTAHGGPTDTARSGPAEWAAAVHRAIADPSQPRLVVQPIVDLRGSAVAGYEVLARFDGPPAASPDRWIAAAHVIGMGPALEARICARSMALLGDLPPNCFLTVNVSPSVVGAEQLDAAFRSPGRLDRLVVELTEHTDVDDKGHVRAWLDGLRDRGALVAMDDAGTGYAGLAQLLHYEPDIVKLDRELVAGIDRNPVKRALAEMLGNFVGRMDCYLLAEGIERPGELHTLIDLGVPLGQGYLLGRPAPRWPALDRDAHGQLARQVRRRPGDETVGTLIEPVDTVDGDPEQAPAQYLSAHPDADLVLALDVHRRPARLLDRAAFERHERPAAPMRVSPAAAVADVAHRAMARTSPARRFEPVACTDETGACLGVVRVERIVSWLAEHADAPSSAPITTERTKA
jgi:EAL domain-containing protein (putative c-di-GMP-specific phosphodiesterase class I)